MVTDPFNSESWPALARAHPYRAHFDRAQAREEMWWGIAVWLSELRILPAWFRHGLADRAQLAAMRCMDEATRVFRTIQDDVGTMLRLDAEGRLTVVDPEGTVDP